MNVIAIICCVLAVLLVGSYVVRMAGELLKVIYEVAPIIVPLLIIGLILYATGHSVFP